MINKRVLILILTDESEISALKLNAPGTLAVYYPLSNYEGETGRKQLVQAATGTISRALEKVPNE